MKSSFTPSNPHSPTTRSYVRIRYSRTSGKRGSRIATRPGDLAPLTKSALPLNLSHAFDSSPTYGTESQSMYLSPARWTASTCAFMSGKREATGIQSPVAEKNDALFSLCHPSSRIMVFMPSDAARRASLSSSDAWTSCR